MVPQIQFHWPILFCALLLSACPEDVSQFGEEQNCEGHDDCADNQVCSGSPGICVTLPTDAGANSTGDGGAPPPDAGPLPDGGPQPDAGSGTDGGIQAESGPTSDGGVAVDAGSLSDAGPDSDGGMPIDGGVTVDGGLPGDGGPTLDGSVGFDSGDGGNAEAGVAPDSGAPVADGGVVTTDGGPPTMDAGCPLVPPANLNLSCPDGTNPVDCDVTLTDGDGGPMPGWADCIECNFKRMADRIYETDFGSGSCNLDGWTTVTGNVCTDNINSCTPGGMTNETCCSDEGFFCVNEQAGSGYTIKADKACPQDKGEEVRLRRTVDLSNHVSGRVCVEIETRGGAGGDDKHGIVLVAEENGGTRTQLNCQNGNDFVDGDERTVCADIPASFDGTSFTLEMILHSETAGERVYADALYVEAFPAGCTPTPVSTLDELTGCNANADSLANWSVLQGDLRCEGGWTGCGTGNVPIAEVDTVILERTFSVHDIDSGQELCVLGGEDGANGGESVEIAIDEGFGYQTVAAFANNEWGSDKNCVEHCLDLQPFLGNPAARGFIGMQIHMHADDKPIGVGAVTFKGLGHCNAVDQGHASVTAMQDNGDGSYAFAVDDQTGGVLRLSGHCWVGDMAPRDRDNFVIFP
jgi:hypothetical protein